MGLTDAIAGPCMTTVDCLTSRRSFILGSGAFAAVSMFPTSSLVAAVDGRTVNPMELQLVHWLNLGESDRGIFLRGFSVGWFRAIDPESDEVKRGKPDALLESIDHQITKLANKSETAHAPLVAALSRATILGWLPPLELLGKEWMKFQMRHRILSLQAFVAGAHSEAVWRELGQPSDSLTLNRGLREARMVVRSPLPLNPNLMLARLNDFYEDSEKLETPFSDAVSIVDRHNDGAPKETIALE
jgi:hypothetical protein